MAFRATYPRAVPIPYTLPIAAPKRGCKRAAGAGEAGLPERRLRQGPGHRGPRKSYPASGPGSARWPVPARGSRDGGGTLPSPSGEGSACAGEVAPAPVSLSQNPGRVARPRPQPHADYPLRGRSLARRFIAAPTTSPTAPAAASARPNQPTALTAPSPSPLVGEEPAPDMIRGARRADEGSASDIPDAEANPSSVGFAATFSHKGRRRPDCEAT